MRPDIVPGSKFPEYELSDHAGKHRTLSELQEHDPMMPGLIIYKIYVDYWFFGRPGGGEFARILARFIKKCRPDWDITTPEMKTAWKQGRKELFYPYGKHSPKQYENRRSYVSDKQCK